MDLFEAIETRCTVRKFKDDNIPLEDIKTIINAARLAPSSTNAQTWHYLVIYNDEIKQKMKKAIADKYDEILSWEESKDKQDSISHYKNYSTFFTDAPVNIAVLMEEKTSVIEGILREKGIPEAEIRRSRPRPDLLSIGASIENLSLAAHALGYGTCWLTAPLCAYKELENLLKVKPPYQLVSLMSLGKPFSNDNKQKPKKPLTEILTVIK